MQDAVWLIMVLKTMLQLAIAKLIDNKWESFYSLNDAWISYMYREFDSWIVIEQKPRWGRHARA